MIESSMRARFLARKYDLNPSAIRPTSAHYPILAAAAVSCGLVLSDLATRSYPGSVSPPVKMSVLNGSSPW